MTKDIVGKLMQHLAKSIDDEPSLVYLLAQVRKLLDRDNPKDSLGALRMYCHWALHVDLTRPATTMDFLRRVECWVTNTVAGLNPSGSWDIHDERKLLEDFIFLDMFRQQLREFLGRYGLPVSLCDETAQWFAFIAAYGGVIEDGSLSTEADKNGELQAVKRVTFTKGEDLPAGHHVPFVIQWQIDLKDGRTLTTSVETVPGSDGTMMAHHLKLT
jgi:hypothetical protein